MPSIKQDVILQIAGNLKAFLKLELGVTRGELSASGNGSAQEQELRRARARITQQKRQIKQLRKRQRQAGGGRQGEKKDGRIKKLRGQRGRMRGQGEGCEGSSKPRNVNHKWGKPIHRNKVRAKAEEGDPR